MKICSFSVNFLRGFHCTTCTWMFWPGGYVQCRIQHFLIWNTSWAENVHHMRKISSSYYLNMTFVFPVSCVSLLTFTVIHNSKLYCCVFRVRIQDLRYLWWWLWMCYYTCSLGDLPSFWDSMHGLSYSKMSVKLFQTLHCHIPEDNLQIRCVTNYFQFVYYAGPSTF